MNLFTHCAFRFMGSDLILRSRFSKALSLTYAHRRSAVGGIFILAPELQLAFSRVLEDEKRPFFCCLLVRSRIESWFVSHDSLCLAASLWKVHGRHAWRSVQKRMTFFLVMEFH